ncbi:3-dehydroquinate synthase [Heliorestis acidaminivorans]|uniref:3-dehydroquinate synthase n=1 Tax=Heliorestis acidaminivorans TaxID=553427 RepID=A0A6I0F2M8_9FIRM|nr:3-dehydroquinate synthase [Heliorestis acidaminivorans]KAB2951305.1 3-dehydroquinate synthase [Heliorestis acidaminivorans]
MTEKSPTKNIQAQVEVQLDERSYPIYIGHDILTQAHQILESVIRGKKILLVTNNEVYDLHGHTLQLSMEKTAQEVQVVTIPDGEQHKNLEILSALYDAAVEGNLERSSVVVALGGGIVGDMAGLLAATYMRGIGFVQVPTTLLAQVDSSVGGKVAVNHLRGKNLIGAFYQPQAVLIDTKTLETLPEREINAGFAEVIKTAMLGDSNLFSYLEDNIDNILKLKPIELSHVIAACCRVKAAVVSADEEEHGIRAILNLGHTYGHAIETLTNYQTYRHGEAVAIGMIAACRLAEKVNNLTPEIRERLTKLLEKANLPTQFPLFPREKWQMVFALDKKVKAGNVIFILPERIGSAQIVNTIPLESALEVVEELQKDS